MAWSAYSFGTLKKMSMWLSVTLKKTTTKEWAENTYVLFWKHLPYFSNAKKSRSIVKEPEDLEEDCIF